MRAIDDFAMQYSIHQMQTNIFSFSWDKVLYFFDYAYGWLFWIVYSILTFPFYIYSQIIENEFSEQLVIFSVRQVSVLILCLILVYSRKLFYLVLQKSNTDSLVISKYLSTSWLLYPAVGYWAGRPQPPLLVTLILIFACYRIMKLETVRSKDLIYFFLLLSLIVGTKLNTILVIPYVCGFVYIFRKKQILNALRKLSFVYTFPIIFFSFFLASSPMILFQPKEYGLKFLRNIELFSRLSVGQEFSYTNFIANLQVGLVKNTIGVSSLIIVIATVSLLLSPRKIEASSRMYLTLLLVATILLIAMVSVNGPSYFNSYVMSLSIFFPIHMYFIFPERTKILLTIGAFFILTGLATLILSLSRVDKQTESINSYQIIHKRALLNNEYSLRSRIEKLIDTYRDKEYQVIQDHTIPTAKTNFDPSVELNFVYGNWETAKLSLPSETAFLLVDYRQKFGKLNLSANDFQKFYDELTQNLSEDKVIDQLNQKKVFDGSICGLLKIIDGVGVYRCVNG